jgi:sugar lactone lactonase YvrE
MRLLVDRRAIATVAVAIVCLLMAPAATAAGPSARVIADGLNNPRGVTVSSSGRVLVAEAGTGKVLAIRGHKVSTAAWGLPVATSPEGESTGVVNVAVRDGDITVAIGGGPQAVNPHFDTVLRVRRHSSRLLADIQAYRNAHPDTTDLDQPPNPTDSNAYGIAAISRDRFLVTDAAGNELDLIGSSGRVWTVAKFPNALISTAHLPPSLGLPPMLPAEAVPTSVAVGPDGWWYVSELKGFPFTPGASRIWRISPSARNVVCDPTATHGPCTVFADGLTSVTGIDFGPDGALYVVEIAKAGVINLFIPNGDTTGALIRIKHGQRTELVAGQLHAPDDVAVARNGTIYVTNQSVSPTGGQVLAIR